MGFKYDCSRDDIVNIKRMKIYITNILQSLLKEYLQKRNKKYSFLQS